MSGYGQKIQKVMMQPINLVFRFFQKKLRVQVSKNLIKAHSYLIKKSRLTNVFKIWLYDVVNVRLEGVIIGFDEYMNLVLDDVEELNVKV